MAPQSRRLAKTSWQFVNTTTPEDVNDSRIQRVIRTHVMREFSQRRREARDRDARTTYSNEAGIVGRVEASVDNHVREAMRKLQLVIQKDTHVDPFLDEDTRSMGTLQEKGDDEGYQFDFNLPERTPVASPSTVLDTGLIDPFNTLPTGGSPECDSSVLRHFAFVLLTVNPIPVVPRQKENFLLHHWLPQALHDSQMFLSTLTFATAYLQTLNIQYQGPEALLYKGETIRAINASLYTPSRAISDSTIRAVAMLAGSESLIESYDEQRIHMSGLQKMVDMRGGLEKIASDDSLNVFILWQDLIYSAMVAEAPHYEMISWCSSDTSRLSVAMPPTLGFHHDRCNELSALFADMRCLTSTMINPDENYPGVRPFSFNKRRTAIEYLLLSLKLDTPAVEWTLVDYYFDICRLGALTYAQRGLHLFLPSHGNMRSLKLQIMNRFREMEDTYGTESEDTQLRILTWTLFVGGVLSTNDAEQDWFAQRIARGVRAAGISIWEEMEQDLAQICWLDMLCTPTCESLWRRVQQLNVGYWAAYMPTT